MSSSYNNIKGGQNVLPTRVGDITVNLENEKPKHLFLEYMEGGTDLRYRSIFDFSQVLIEDQGLHPKEYINAMENMNKILLAYDP